MKRLTIGDYVITLILILFALAIIIPMWYVISIALVSETTFLTTRPLLYPVSPTFENFQNIFHWRAIRTGMFNSAMVSIVGTFYVLFLNITFAYALMKPIPGKKFFWILLMIPMFFGGGLVPTFRMMVDLGFMNNRLVLLLPHGIGIITVFLLQSYMRNLAHEYEESARIDGAGDITILIKILLPLCKPIIATIALFAAVGGWNRWVEGILYLQHMHLQPMQMVLQRILLDAQAAMPDLPVEARREAFTRGLQMAAVVITMFPIVCVYPFLQKHFVKGITLGGVKG